MDNKKSFAEITQLALKAVGLSMGVAIIVLGALGNTPVQTQVTLLGIGLFCLGLSALQNA